MAYTFGGATGDDITISLATMCSDNRQGLVSGWFYPTTLTATRKYWGAGTTIGAEVDSTTSEIRMRTDNTTDGQWLTSGAGIVTNKWQFIAWIWATENTTVAGAWRVFVGDIETAPVEITVNNPTPRSGNYTGNANFTIGNAGSAGTVAFQGDIDSVSVITSTAPGINSPLGIGTSGAISNDEALAIKERIIWPLWLGTPNFSQVLHVQTYGDAFTIAHIPLDGGLVAYVAQEAATTPTPTIEYTPSGATVTAARAPRLPPHNWPLEARPARR